MSAFELEGFLERMIHKMLDGKLPQDEIERMIPELKQKMLSKMSSFSEEDPEDEMDFDSLFDRMPNNSRKKKGRTKGGFQELF